VSFEDCSPHRPSEGIALPRLEQTSLPPQGSNLIKADVRFLPFALLRRRYLCLQPQLEVNMQNGSIIRRNRKRHSDIWQFRWREKTSEGKRIYRRREIGTVDEIQDLETARKAASLLVPDLNARMAKSRSVSMTIAQLSSHFEQCELCLGNTWRSYSTKQIYRSTCADGLFRDGANTY
jgi:hypothetical protein